MQQRSTSSDAIQSLWRPQHLRVRLRGDFSVSYTSRLPELGSQSDGARILSEVWSAGHDMLTVELEGSAGKTYELAVFNGGQISGVEGGKLAKSTDGAETITVTLLGGEFAANVRSTLTIHFGSKPGSAHPKP